MSWTDYLDAVIRGDLNRVKNQHSEKDFRVFLSGDNSALDIAAHFGHEELIEYFLDSVVKFTNDSGEYPRVLVSALRFSIIRARLSVTKRLFSRLIRYEEEFGFQAIKKMVDRNTLEDLHRRSISCCDVETLNAVQEYLSRFDPGDINPMTDFAWKRCAVTSALSTGSTDMLSAVLECLDAFEFLVDMYSGIDSEAFVHCALGNAEKVLETIEQDTEPDATPWYKITAWSGDPFSDVVSFTINSYRSPEGPDVAFISFFGLAAQFGHTQLLKKMVARVEGINACTDVILEEILLYAWSTDRVEIVRWLHESGKVKLRAPHTYKWMGVFGTNRVFKYVREVCPSLEGLVESSKADSMGNVVSLTTEASMDIIEHYLRAARSEKLEIRSDYLFTEIAMSDCARLAIRIPSFLPNYDCSHHHKIIDAWCCGDYFEKELPNLPLMEMILERMPGRGDTCDCGSLNYLDLVLKYQDYYDISNDDNMAYDVFYRHMESAITLLLNHGARPQETLVKQMFRVAVESSIQNNPHILSRLFGLMNLMDVTVISDNISRVFTTFPDICHRLYQSENEQKKDAVYFNILRGFAGCNARTIEFPYFLMHLLRVDRARRRKFIQSIRWLGVVIVDPVLRDSIDEHSAKPDFEAVRSLMYNRVSKLSVLIRNRFMKHIRRSQINRLVSRELCDVLTFEKLVENLASTSDIRSLPSPLPDLFKLPAMAAIQTGT